MDKRRNLFDGKRVQALLNERGLTAVEIATQAGISRVQMSSYIHGHRNPKRITVQRIADALRVNISEISDYQDNEEIITAPLQSLSTPNENSVYKYVVGEITRQVANENQSIVAKRIEISHAQVNRIINGKADLSLFPIGALIRLCPQIINYDVVNGKTTDNDELLQTIAQIKQIADNITDLNTAKTVLAMLNGLTAIK